MAPHSFSSRLGAVALLVIAAAASAACNGKWDPAGADTAHRIDLYAHGTRARAEVLSIYDPLGHALGSGCSCTVTVRVFPPRGAPFETTIKHYVTAVESPHYQPGSILTVRYLSGDSSAGIVESVGFVEDTDAAVASADLSVPDAARN